MIRRPSAVLRIARDMSRIFRATAEKGDIATISLVLARVRDAVGITKDDFNRTTLMKAVRAGQREECIDADRVRCESGPLERRPASGVDDHAEVRRSLDRERGNVPHDGTSRTRPQSGDVVPPPRPVSSAVEELYRLLPSLGEERR
jgi:hypothetical protein